MSWMTIFIVVTLLKNMSQTYQPKNRKRNKTHGFLVRSTSKAGKKILQNRRRKGRTKISV